MSQQLWMAEDQLYQRTPDVAIEVLKESARPRRPRSPGWISASRRMARGCRPGALHTFVNHTQRNMRAAEVHEHRAECLFPLLKPYLRVFRGISKLHLPGYLGFSNACRTFDSRRRSSRSSRLSSQLFVASLRTACQAQAASRVLARLVVVPGGAGWATGWARAVGGKGRLIFRLLSRDHKSSEQFTYFNRRYHDEGLVKPFGNRTLNEV
jgi:hypothetical protein